MSDIPKTTFWLFVGLFSTFAIICLVLAIVVRQSSSKVTDPAFFNAYCVGISCPGQSGTGTFFFKQEDGGYVTRNYCVDNAPTYKQLTSIMRCSQDTTSPEFRFWHTDNRIGRYAKFFNNYVNTCGPNWTYSNIRTDLPNMPENFAENVNMCNTQND